MSGAAVACTVTNIETHADPIDAASLDGTLPDVAVPDVSAPDALAPADASSEDGGRPEPDGGGPDASPGDARADVAVDCGAAPLLRPPLDASIFCPFSAPFGQPPLRCAPTEECCETPPDAGVLGTCEPKGAACAVPGSTRWECQDTSNCTSGQICCAFGADGGALGINPPGTCAWPYLTSFDGTRCLSACPAGAVQACEAQASCLQGTCTPLRTRGVELGLCR